MIGCSLNLRSLLLKCTFVVCLVTLVLHASGQTIKVYKNTPFDNQSSNTAVIVCPGGSYYWHDKNAESKQVSQWLTAEGITVYVLEYPTSGWGSFFFHIRSPRRSQYPAQLDAVRSVLKLAYQEGYENVGILGFSAGGHLALNAAEAIHDATAPDFVGAIYPVVTMNEPYVHKRSRRGLLGERRRNDQAMRDSLSLELHVDKLSCPVFLVNCKDDPVVDYQNSVIFNDAMRENGKSNLITYIQYPEGGHGFGADPDKTNSETIKWKQQWLEWLKSVVKTK